jgi:hypothetical protein
VGEAPAPPGRGSATASPCGSARQVHRPPRCGSFPSLGTWRSPVAHLSRATGAQTSRRPADSRDERGSRRPRPQGAGPRPQLHGVQPARYPRPPRCGSFPSLGTWRSPVAHLSRATGAQTSRRPADSRDERGSRRPRPQGVGPRPQLHGVQSARYPRPPRCGSFPSLGTWRSPVAHLNGVQGVAGSNPAVPITAPQPHGCGAFVFRAVIGTAR